MMNTGDGSDKTMNVLLCVPVIFIFPQFSNEKIILFLLHRPLNLQAKLMKKSLIVEKNDRSKEVQSDEMRERRKVRNTKEH